MPAAALDEAYRKIILSESPSLLENNRTFHKYAVEGVPISFRSEGRIVHKPAHLFDFENLANNEFIAVNQYTMIENRNNRRPDNELLIASDGLEARIGSLTADWDWFMPWRTVDGEKPAAKGTPQLETLIKGVFHKERLLDYLRYFVTFNTDGAKIIKKIAGYHQFHAVNKAVDCTVKATMPKGTKKVGVVWHTQGSGKSLSMAFYAGKVVQHAADETLRIIAQELVRRVRENVSIDWTVKESVRAKIRIIVKNILRRYGYPPDKQEKATQTVLEQAEMLCKDWAG